MKLKILSLAAVAAVAMMAFAAGSASAATLEIGGVGQGGSVAITASLQPGTSSITKDTEGFSANTCTTSHIAAETKQNFHTAPTGPISSLTFGNCTRPVTVHTPGKLEFTSAGGTNGNVYLENATITEGTAFGTVTCHFGATTKIGTLTGVASNHATLDVNAVVDCGFPIPTMNWNAIYTVTSPTGLGVTS